MIDRAASVYAPFTPDEFAGRIERVRSRLRERELAALVLFSPENIYYLTGLNHQGYFAFTALVLPLDGAPQLVARAMERETLIAQVPECELVLFADHAEPAAALARAVSAVASHGAPVGIEKNSMWMPIEIWEHLQSGLREIEFTDAGGLVDDLRQVKSPQEIVYVRQAAAASSLAIEAGLDAVRAGESQSAVAAAAYEAMIRAGSEYPGFAPLVRPRSLLLQEHVTWRDERIASDDAVFLELSASRGRYHAPLTRMAYVGDAPAGTGVAAGIAAAGLEAVRAALVPGALNGEVYAAWQAVIDDGLGHADYRRHHCGYAVGIGFPPSWVGGASVAGLRAGETTPIESGMVFHVLSWILGQHPADYVVSDTMLVTPEGGEILTTTRRDPILVAA